MFCMNLVSLDMTSFELELTSSGWNVGCQSGLKMFILSALLSLIDRCWLYWVHLAVRLESFVPAIATILSSLAWEA